MRTLTGFEKIHYLLTLKAYEFNQAKKKPIGERVTYYKVQTDWINAEINEMLNA